MRIRTNVYFPPEILRQLIDLSDRKRVSRSSIVEAALISFLSPDGADRTEAAFTRRLDRLSRQVQRLERDGLVESDGDGQEGPQKGFRITTAGCQELTGWLRTPSDMSSPPRDELVMKVLVALRVPGTDVRDVIQVHRHYLMQLMQQWTRLKEDEAQFDRFDSFGDMLAPFEFTDEPGQDVFRSASVRGHGVEELLDEVVARSVQNDAGPQAAGLQAQPCQNEAKADHVDGDNGQTIPAGSRVVSGEDDDGHMPPGPNDAGENSGRCE